MSASITNAHIEQFKQNVYTRAQQRGSRLSDCVSMEMVTGKLHNFERIGATSVTEKTVQHAPTPQNDVPHDRRQVVLRDFHWAEKIDRNDDYKTIIDIEGSYTRMGVAAVGRKKDELILAAALGNAQAKVPGANQGEYTITNVVLPATQVVPVAASKLTIEKLHQTREILLGADVDEEYDQMVIACNAHQLESLLRTTEVRSADFNTVKALVQGQLDTFMGFKFKRTQITPNDGTNDNAVAWCKSGIGLAVGREMTAKHSERDDLSYSHQIYLEFSCEATRIEEEKVVRIDTTPIS